ncbi:uncharacterized [Tachysurus ichikawai]
MGRVLEDKKLRSNLSAQPLQLVFAPPPTSTMSPIEPSLPPPVQIRRVRPRFDQTRGSLVFHLCLSELKDLAQQQQPEQIKGDLSACLMGGALYSCAPGARCCMRLFSQLSGI